MIFHAYLELLFFVYVESESPGHKLFAHKDCLLPRNPLLVNNPVNKVFPGERLLERQKKEMEKKYHTRLSPSQQKSYFLFAKYLDLFSEAQEALLVLFDDPGLLHFLDERGVLVQLTVHGLAVDGGNV